MNKYAVSNKEGLERSLADGEVRVNVEQICRISR
jgi:hypothetical protein